MTSTRRPRSAATTTTPRIPPGVTTPTGQALVSWVRPALRSAYSDSVRRIERESARTALLDVRTRIVESDPDIGAEGLLAIIDAALDSTT